MEIIIGKQGSQKMKIEDPYVSRKHCKVTVNADGTYTVENLSPNGTQVDGIPVLKTTAKLNSRIQLGPDFSATLVELIGVPEAAPAPKPAAPQQPRQQPAQQTKEVKTFNISHLRRVWDDFNDKNLEIAEENRKVGMIRTATPIFTVGAGALSALTGIGVIGWVLTGIGALGFIYSFAVMRNAETAAERQQRQDAFDDAWVCPNPECGHSIIAKNYKMLVKNHKSCPYCKCNYVER